MQKDVGLKVCTDGDFRRANWQRDFLNKITGVVERGGLPMKFHSEQGSTEFAPPRFEVHGKLKRERDLAVQHFRALKPIAARHGLTPKQTIPSPMCLHFRGGRAAIDASVYPDMEEFFEDLARVYREEIAALYAAGCRYVQIDDTNLAYLCDPKLLDHVLKIGEHPDHLPKLYARMVNDAIRDKPADMTVCLHMCRGNRTSSWVAEGGYDPIATVFAEMKVDGFFLEYDSPRAGSFEPLRHLSDGKVAVLGLVTTKKPDLESKDVLKRRIDEAAKLRSDRAARPQPAMRLRLDARGKRAERAGPGPQVETGRGNRPRRLGERLKSNEDAQKNVVGSGGRPDGKRIANQFGKI